MMLKQPKCLMITQILMKCPIYKIDLEIKNASRNKSKIEEVGNQVSKIQGEQPYLKQLIPEMKLLITIWW